MTNKEKQKAIEDTTKKLSVIFTVNGVDFWKLTKPIVRSVLMAYQQGLKDAEDLLR